MSSIEALSALTVPKLKEKCRELGLPVGGKKADLITRIQNKLSDTGEVIAPSDASLSKPTPSTSVGSSKPAARTKGSIKRKPSLESLVCTPSKKVSGNKKKRTSKDAEVADKILPTSPPPAPALVPALALATATAVSISKGNIQSVALLDSRKDKAREGSNTTGTAKVILPTTTTPEIMYPGRPNRFRASNPITSSGRNPGPQNRTRSSAHDQAAGQSKDAHNQPEINSSKPNQGNLHTATLKLNPVATKGPGENEKTVTTKRKGVLAATNQKKGDVFLSVHGSISVHQSSLDMLRPPKADRRRFSGLSVTSSPGVRYQEKDNPGVVAPVRIMEASIGPNEEEPRPNIEHTEKDITIRPPVRGFKGLKLRIKTTDSNNATVPSSSFTTSTPPTTRKRDDEILSSIIRNPPRYSFRREVERIARVLALVAFYSCSFEDSTAPGCFLKNLALVSRKYRYASTLAFTNLVKFEFRGKRTQNWFKNKGIDEKVADVRPWYWYRVSERASIIERFRTSWIERVWRFLVLALESIKPSIVGSPKPVKFGLWFNGINQHLITDPDFIGQFETSVRFWIRRFYVWVTRNGGGYPLLLQDLRDEMIQDIQPLVETENQDLWRVETKCGDVHFIVGLTGEVIGRVEVEESAGSGLNPVLRRARTRIGTIIRSRTRASRLYSQINERRRTNIDNVTWKDLREDWKEHALTLVSPSTTPEELNTSSRRLIESVYRPDSKTVSNGIHESIKLPHHRALAERWVLAQVEPGGISGKPVLDAIHSPMRRKEKLGLDLQAKLIVESVRCSGEKWISSMNGCLAQGVGFVHTPGMGWFVLEETGQNIAQEDYGIQGLWATVLGVNENGSALSADALEGLAEMFVMKDTLD